MTTLTFDFRDAYKPIYLSSSIFDDLEINAVGYNHQEFDVQVVRVLKHNGTVDVYDDRDHHTAAELALTPTPTHFEYGAFDLSVRFFATVSAPKSFSSIVSSSYDEDNYDKYIDDLGKYSSELDKWVTSLTNTPVTHAEIRSNGLLLGTVKLKPTFGPREFL